MITFIEPFVTKLTITGQLSFKN